MRIIRVLFKLLKRTLMPTVSFCKCCGRDVHDFSAPDDIWKEVDSRIKFGHVLCYDCFCEVCGELGFPTVWKLVRK